MYHLIGFEENLANIASLPHARGNLKPSSDLRVLKRRYRAYLKSIQPAVTVASGDTPEFVSDRETAGRLLRLYMGGPDGRSADRKLLQAVENVGAGNARTHRDRLLLLRTALDKLRRLDGDLGRLFDLVINKILCFPCAGSEGGTSQKAIGVLWINPKSYWKRDDVVEFYVHELSHNLLLLDEEFNWHYKDYETLSRAENFAVSSFRGVPRRLDLALHSLVVGVEILLLRDGFLGHPKRPRIHPRSEEIVKNCRATADSIRAIPGWKKLFRERGREIFSLCRSSLEKM